MTIPLEHMRGVSARGGLTLHPSVTVSVEQEGRIRNVVLTNLTQAGGSPLKHISTIAPSTAQRILNASIEKRLYAMDEGRKKDRIQYVLDFTFLKAEMEKGGVVVQTIKCPNCGASSELPSTGSRIGCIYCGIPVLAQDVFNKMKGIIGTL